MIDNSRNLLIYDVIQFIYNYSSISTDWWLTYPSEKYESQLG